MNGIRVTVFVPTWFGERYLADCLRMVFAQKVDYKYEVLIYDTSSQDATPEIIEKFAKEHKNLRHRIITKAEFGHGRTRQEAAKDAKGEIIVYLTQDAIPAHDRWLYEITKPFDISKDIVAVMGKQIPRPNCIPMLKSEINAVFSGFGPDFGTTLYYKDTFMQDRATHDAASFYSDVNSATRREFLLKTVPYRDVRYAEDQLFGRDVIDGGYIKVYAPRAAVVHSNDLSLREYSKRMFDETRGLIEVGVASQAPAKKTILKMVIRGILRDTMRILRDSGYSGKRKLYWLALNPLFHIEKWRGVSRAYSSGIDNGKYSLEETKHSS